MRKNTTTVGFYFAFLASPALAASAAGPTADNDVRCFLLSNAFAKQAADEKARGAAAASVAFYLGRLDGKIAAPAIAAAIRRVGPTIDQKTASTQMTACVARMGRVEQAIQVAVKAGGPAKK
jgi:hypothetical protein